MKRNSYHKINQILKSMLVLTVILTVALSAVTAHAASPATYDDIVSGLGGCYGYDVTADLFTQSGHSEGSVNINKLVRNADPPLLTSGRGQRSAPDYDLTADLTIMGAHDAIDDMEFAVFKKTASGYTRVSDIVSAHTGAIDASTNTVTGLTFHVTSNEDKVGALYVMQVENGSPVPNGEANSDNLFVQYGDSAEFDPSGVVASDATNYIGTIEYPNKRDNIAFKIMQESGDMATEGYDLKFGPGIGLYEKVGNSYVPITDATTHSVNDVYIQFSSVKYVYENGKGSWTYEDAPISIELNVTHDTNDDLADAATLSRSLGSVTGGVCTKQANVWPTGGANSTSTSATDSDGNVVSYYDLSVVNGTPGPAGGIPLQTGIPISDKEYIVFNVRIPRGTTNVNTPDASLLTQDGKVSPSMWGGQSNADLSAFTRIIWNYVYEDGSPYEGTVTYRGDCGGMTLAPKATVDVTSVANAASIVAKSVATNGVEIHQTLFGGGDKEAKTQIKMYPTGGVIFDKKSRPVTGSSSAPVAGATFDIYAGSGDNKKVWDTVTSGADGKVNFRGLRAVDADGNPIQYYIVETSPAPGYKADTTAYGPYTVTANDQEKPITFNGSNTLYNDVETGDLKLSKTQAGTKKSGDDQLKFTFSVKITPANAAMAVNGLTFTGSDGKTYVSSGASNGSFVLKDTSGNEPTVGVGQTLTFQDLPAGQYSVSETGVIPSTAGEFQSSSNNASGTISDDATPTAAFINTRMEHKGKLTLTKKVRPAGSGDSGEPLSGVVFTIKDAAGNTVGTMHESPAGSGVYVSDDLACETQDSSSRWYDNYTVYEDVPAGTYRSDGATGTVKLGTVKVYAGTTATAFSSSPVMNEYVRGVIRINKTSKTVPNNTSFSFTLTVSPDLASFRDDNSLTVKVGGNNTTLTKNGDGTFSGNITVKVGQTVTITDVPYGSFTVTENNANNYDTTWTFVNKGSGNTVSGSGKIASGELDSANIWYAQDTNVGSNVSFNNEIDTTAEIRVRKNITGDTPPSSEAFTFTLAPVNNAPMPAGDTVTVVGAREGVFGEIKYTQAGTYQYTVTETNGGVPGYTYDTTPKTVTVTVTNVNGVLSPVVNYPSGSDAVDVTNRYEDTEKGQIAFSGTKYMSGRPIRESDVFTFTVTDEAGNVVSTGVSKGSEITFTPIYYTTSDIGEHHYTITEDESPDPLIDTIDEEYNPPCHVTVAVSRNPNVSGELVAEITENDKGTINFINDYAAGYIHFFKYSYGTEDNVSLAGVKFEIYKDQACTQYVGEVVSDDNGRVIYGPIPLGDYWVKEILTDGYSMVPGVTNPFHEQANRVEITDPRAYGYNVVEETEVQLRIAKSQVEDAPDDFGTSHYVTVKLTAKTPGAPLPEEDSWIAVRMRSDKAVAAQFGNIKFTAADLQGEESKVFEYYITEDMPTNPIEGMTYDTTPHLI